MRSSWFLPLLALSCAPSSPVAAPPAAAPAPAPAPAPPQPAYRALNKAAKVACDAKDYPTCRARLLELLGAMHGHPRVVVALASVDVHLGDTADALARLRTFEAMGLTMDVAADADLAPLAKDGEGRALAERIKQNGRPRPGASVVRGLPADESIPEDVAYDAAGRRWFTSSVRRRAITVIEEGGAPRDFVKDAPSGVLGLALDARRQVLWASFAALPHVIGFKADDEGTTGVVAYDARTGALVRRIDLSRGKGHAIGDLSVTPGGDVIASDGFGGGVYLVRAGGAAFEDLVPEGTFASPQTPAVTADGRRVLVPDYVLGLAFVDLATHAVSWLPHPPHVALNGIDGVYFDGSTVLAVQNGTSPPRVVRLMLDANASKVEWLEVLEQATPGLGEPTHGTMVGRDFVFIANAGWSRFDDDGKKLDGAPPDAPALWKLAL